MNKLQIHTLALCSERDAPSLLAASGDPGLAALESLRRDPQRSAQVGLTAESRVLIISTEGATAPREYTRLVGQSAEQVLQRQQAWQAAHALQTQPA